MSEKTGGRERWNYADLVEAAEQTVRRYEELELSLDLAAAEAWPATRPWPWPPARTRRA